MENPIINVEDVFCDSGVPKYTYVQPSEYNKLKVSLRTKGKGVIVEGPSGIGKTTCVKKILADINIEAKYLSARKEADKQEVIELLKSPSDRGIIIIDDFHVFNVDIKHALSDLLKLLADEQRTDTKLVLIGINQAGDTLLHLSPDLMNRIEKIKFGSCTDEQLGMVIEQGEKALNITIVNKNDILSSASGSFQTVQMLCKELCLQSGITESSDDNKDVVRPIKDTIASILNDMYPGFEPPLTAFARGNRVRKGRHIYLRMIMWLSKSDDSVLSLTDACLAYPQYKPSITQVINKDYISSLLEKEPLIKRILYYNTEAKTLSVEDPKFFFFIQNIDWRSFCDKKGLVLDDEKTSYDFALSFTGEKREYAKLLKQKLADKDYAVFYDEDYGHEMLAGDLANYLKPIYEADAKFVVALIDSMYASKFWTITEAGFYKNRTERGEVIPVFFQSEQMPGPFDPMGKIRFLVIDTSKSIDSEIEVIVKELEKFYQVH